MDHLRDIPDILSSDLLPHTVIPPIKLAELLDHVKRKFIEHFKEYELAMAKIFQHYDLPSVAYSYIDDIIVLQITISVIFIMKNAGTT